MAQPSKKYTHLGVLVETQKKVAILSKIRGKNIYDLVETWAAEDWEKAKKEGLVTDAMIQPSKQSPINQKKSPPARAVAVAI